MFRTRQRGFTRNELLVVMVIVIIVVIAAILQLRSAILASREAACRSICTGHMNQLQRALQNYESANGRLPPAFITGPDGTPWHSWRVLILPFLGENEVFEQYNFDEPWNGPNNKQLADKINVEMYQCPSGPGYGETYHTNYVAIVGSETAFPGSASVKLADIKDGLENTILLAEIGNSDIHWMEPRDIEFDSVSLQTDPRKASSTAISCHHSVGPAVVFADHITAFRLQMPFKIETLRALLTIAGDEPVTKEQLRKHYSSTYLSESED